MEGGATIRRRRRFESLLVADASDVFVSQMSNSGRSECWSRLRLRRHLRVSLLTVQPGCEIAPRKSPQCRGFYYVSLSEAGLFSQQGECFTSMSR
jgi:hypothetical protein